MADASPEMMSIFSGALERLTPEERATYLELACGKDLELRARIEALMRAHEEASGFLADKPVDPRATIDQPAERPGAVIGRYKLLQQIGEGGMGVVFMAEQEQPVRRRVALKIIKPGMDSRQIIARFEAERQALAMMDHINIARVLDAGATEAGRPYFVMELVNGVPITKYCDDNHLTPRERLELFVPVCQAIQHAHQKGIIHRDIKPSNVLVTLYDGRPVPKVIDFGVAKATEQKLTERTLFTQHGTMVGTLEYMSPEQAEISALGVDTRGDIYSLGVLLYELLTGSTPLSHMQLKRAAHGEALRIIKEEEPPKPSTRVSDSGEALASISAQRKTEPGKLSKLMRGDLDWIVMKTLEKDRNRRYETANAFAADLQHYLNDEPVQAGPPSASYRLWKFVRRNRGPVTAGVALVVLLVLGIVGTSIGLAWALQAERTASTAAAAEAQQRQDAEKQRDRAVAAEKKAVAAEKKAVEQKSRADEEAAVAKAVNDFLQKDMLAEASPEKNARAKKVTVEEALGRAAKHVAGKFPEQPLIEAAIRQTIGDTYRALGNYAAAQPHQERALEVRRCVLGEEHPDTLLSMNNLGTLYRDQGQNAKAEPLFVKTLEARRRVLGEEHSYTLNSMNNLAGLYEDQGLYTKAMPLYIKTLEIRRRVFGEEHPGTLAAMNNLAELYKDQGKYAKAEPLYVKALEVMRRVVGEEQPDTLTTMNNLALLYQAKGQYAKAEPLFVKGLEVRCRVLGEEHPDTVSSMNNLGVLYQDQGLYAKAEPLVVKALEARRRVLGEEHPDTLTSMNDLTALYWHQGQYAKAEPLVVKVFEIQRRVLGEEHPDTLTIMNNLAALYRALGQLAKAEPLFIKALDIQRRTLGQEHPRTLTLMNNLAALYWSNGKPALAIPLLEAALKIHKAKLGPDHPETLGMMANLGINYRDAGRLKDAVPLLEAADRGIQALPPENRHFFSWVRGQLADTYVQAGRPEKGEELLREQVGLFKQSAGPDSPFYAEVLARLGQVLLQEKKWAKAESVLREGLAISERKEADEWRTFNAKSALGDALLGQKKYADAEPLLLAGYEGLKQRATKIPPVHKVRFTEALERLVQLYEALGKKDKAAQWRKILEAEKAVAKPPDK